MFYVTVFAIPALFVLVMGLFDRIVNSGPWQDWITDLGWDCQVLAWGALGGVFSNGNITNYFVLKGEAEAAELLCVGILLLTAIAIMALRRRKPQVGWKALLSLAVGGFALVVPGAIAFRAHM